MALSSSLPRRGSRASSTPSRVPGLLADDVDGQRQGLALHREGPGRGDGEQGAGVLEHVGVRVDQPGGAVAVMRAAVLVVSPIAE